MSARALLIALDRVPVAKLYSLATSCGQTQGAGRDPLDSFIALEIERRISDLRGRAPRPPATVVEIPIQALFDELQSVTDALPALEPPREPAPVEFSDEYDDFSPAGQRSFTVKPVDAEPGVMSFEMRRRGPGVLVECDHVLPRAQVVEIYEAIGAWLDTPESRFPPEPR